MKSGIVFGAVGLGLPLLVLSGLWPTLFPGKSNWTHEKEQRWRQVQARIHTLSFVVGNTQDPSMHRGTDLAQAKEEYTALRKENDQLTAEFQSAASRPNTISKMLKWTGISLAALGIIGWYAVKQTS